MMILYDPKSSLLNEWVPSRTSHEKTMKTRYQSLHDPSMPAGVYALEEMSIISVY